MLNGFNSSAKPNSSVGSKDIGVVLPKIFRKLR